MAHFATHITPTRILGLCEVKSVSHLINILSKHWGYQQAWPLMKPLLFWKGDTSVLLEDAHSDQATKGE